MFVDPLVPGNYGFKEVQAVSGYISNTSLVTFEIPNSSFDTKFELVLEDFVNYKGGLVVKKVNPKGTLLSGVVFKLKDVEGNTISEFSTVDGVGVINGLALGTYTLTEVSAPKGYKLSSESFELVTPDAHEGEYVSQEIEVVNILQDVSLPGTGFSSFALFSAFSAVFIGFALILVSRRKNN